MQDIMAELYDYICEHTTSLRNDPEYDRAVQAYMAVEAEVKEKIGPDLLSKYQDAESDLSRKWELAVFTQSLRFGHRFFLEVLG